MMWNMLLAYLCSASVKQQHWWQHLVCGVLCYIAALCLEQQQLHRQWALAEPLLQNRSGSGLYIAKGSCTEVT